MIVSQGNDLRLLLVEKVGRGWGLLFWQKYGGRRGKRESERERESGQKIK